MRLVRHRALVLLQVEWPGINPVEPSDHILSFLQDLLFRPPPAIPAGGHLSVLSFHSSSHFCVIQEPAPTECRFLGKPSGERTTILLHCRYYMSSPHGVVVANGLLVQQPLFNFVFLLTGSLQLTAVLGLWGLCSVLTGSSSVIYPQPGAEVSRVR